MNPHLRSDWSSISCGMVDTFTKYCELIPVFDKSAVTVAHTFKERILDQPNAPSVIITESEGQFNSNSL